MKSTKAAFNKMLSALLTLTILFSLFSGINVVDAASVLSIKYERTRENTLSGPKETNRLIIYGSGFLNPKVKAGQVSEIPIPINASLSNSDVIVIDDQRVLDSIEGIPNKIQILNEGVTDITNGGINFDLSSIPTVSNTSKSKVYINETLDVEGMFFDGLSTPNDELFVAGTKYALSDATNITKVDNKITIKNVKSPINTGLSDVTILRKLGGSPQYQIVSTLKNSITVVDRLKGLEIERVDPNTGPRTKRNLVNIYGKPGYSNFNSSMRIFVNGAEGTNKGTITNLAGTVIGLSVELPTSNIAGAANILITNSDLSSEFEIPNGFIYLDIGNTLTIDTDGINPGYKKETEVKAVSITGRNIGYFDAANYDKLSQIIFPNDGLIGYTSYKTIPLFNNINTYKVKYTGLYNASVPVTVIRQINVFIDGDAKIVNSPSPSFTKSKDTLVVNPADVNLDPNQPKSVDVTIKTTTTIFNETDPNNITIYYTRNEEYTIRNGFMYIPDEITPIINSVTPEFGPNDKDILMTIKGQNFQVFEDGTLPTVKIGDKVIEGKDAEGNNRIRVYDSQNRIVDGKKLAVGTKIKLMLPAGTGSISGAVDVVVKNPSKGQYTLINGFEFRNPSREPQRMPKISTLKEPFADMRGGLLTGEVVLITGENIDTSLEGNHRVIVTIDGDKADIKGKVSADGKTVTVIPPPGTVPGDTKLQIINEDGSMTQTDFEYRRVITAPKIFKIVPEKGGKGTKLVIKGEDFLLPDGSVDPDDPKRKGTVILLNGKELNAYNYLPSGSITNKNDSIYYNGSFDPDGAGAAVPYQLNGQMVKVIDSNTIYVDIPDRFYSFQSGAAPNLRNELIPLGDLSVEVLNPDGAKSKEQVYFTFLKPGTKPVITGIIPSSGSINGGTVVTITGTNFRQDDLKVYFGSELATKVEFVNTTELRVQVPIYPYTIPQGKDNVFVPVMVMNYDGAMGVFETPGFEYRVPGSRPVITSLTPARGSAAGGEEVVIRGRDFRREANNTAPPKVYFNGIEANVQWVGNDNVSELLVVTTPTSKIDGPVDVVIVNYDSGSYTHKSFTYEISKPIINSVVPGGINKTGGTKLQINGSGFKKSDLSQLLNGELVERHLGAGKSAAGQIDTLVVFGDSTTGDKKAIDTVIGPFYTELNDIRIDYTSNGPASGKIKLSKASDPAHAAIRPETVIPIGSAHMFIVNGKQDLGDDKLEDEGILVEVTPNQVIVTRRIAAYARWENNGLQLTAVAPAVSSINERNMYVQNIDGGIASWKIKVMNPASTPTINYIAPRNKVKQAGGIIDYTRENSSADLEYYTYTPINGGAFITINGSDFRRNVKVYLGNKELEIVSRSINDDQLIVKVPKGTEADLDKLYRILIVNEDGASADSSSLSKPHYIVYKMSQSSPLIESIIPGNTSSEGENTIRIIGDDFREGIKVFIDGKESESVTRISYKELAVRVPLGLSPGKKLVQVMNPDYGFGEKKNALNIVSSPQIDTVYDVKKNRAIDPVLFTIDGGQGIRLVGRDYLDGVKVIIGGTLKPKEDLKANETGIKCYNIYDAEMVIVGGVEATNVKIINSRTLTFTTPKLKVGDASVIVVNKDGGVSNVINANYQKPYPDSPTGIFIEAVDSDTIKLEWDKLPETKHYELYAAYSSNGIIVNNYIYVGSVEGFEINEGRLRYYVDGLRANSWYSFKLKSVNDYGPSTFSYATSYVQTKDKKITSFYQVVGDYISGIAQNDKVSVMGNGMTFTAGEKSIGNYGSGLIVYLNQAIYAKYNAKVVDIGLELLKKYPNNPIAIYEKDFNLKLFSSNLLVNETNAVASSKVEDSKMTIAVNKDLKAKGDEIRLKVPKGYKTVINPVAVTIAMQVEKVKTNVRSLKGSADLSFNVNEDIKRRYPGGLYIAYYNSTTKKLEILNSSSNGSALATKASRSGEYMVIGKLTK